MLPSNITREQKPSFWFGVDAGIIVDGVDVMAELEDFSNESIRKRRRTMACGRRRVSRRKRKES